MKKEFLICWAIFLLFLSPLQNVCAQNAASLPPQPPGTGNSNGARQIDKTFPYNIDLKDANAGVINTAKLFKKRKKPVVLLFWLTTCMPCKMELTAIAQKYEGWKKEMDFDLYAISTDFPNRAEQFYTRVRESKWPFAAYYDFNREFKMVMPGELNGLPQVFVLKPSGEIVYHARKYSTGDEDKIWEAVKGIR